LESGRHHFDQQQHQKKQEQKEKKPVEQMPELMPFTDQCTHEMLNHRQMMSQEFRMSPELVMSCAQEIDKFCSPTGDLQSGGQTIHCLLKHAEARDDANKIGATCMQTLQTLMKVADVGSDYKVDKVLYHSCQQLIEGRCKQDLTSESSTLTCLMNNMDGPGNRTFVIEQLTLFRYDR
jgi:Golgi apparatus protein 1